LVRDRPAGRQTHYGAPLGALPPLIDWTSQMAANQELAGRWKLDLIEKSNPRWRDLGDHLVKW
jgi:hypothetical protein